MITADAAAIAVAIVAGIALIFAAVLYIGEKRAVPGRHRLDGEKTAAHFRSLREPTDAAAHVSAPPDDAAAPLPHPASLGVGQPLSPAPLSKALEAVPGGTGPAGAAPAPPGPPSGATAPGQHPFRPVIMQFPGGEVGILGADGRWHIKPLAFDGRSPRETGAQPALVRPAALRHFDHVDRWWTP